MAITGDTGNGATLTFTGGSFSGSLDVISITLGSQNCGTVNASVLATEEFHELLPDDLATNAESSATFKWVGGQEVPTWPSEQVTCTVTFPAGVGGDIAGTALITSFTAPALQNGQLMTGSISWIWDGDTGPEIDGGTA